MRPRLRPEAGLCARRDGRRRMRTEPRRVGRRGGCRRGAGKGLAAPLRRVRRRWGTLASGRGARRGRRRTPPCPWRGAGPRCSSPKACCSSTRRSNSACRRVSSRVLVVLEGAVAAVAVQLAARRRRRSRCAARAAHGPDSLVLVAATARGHPPAFLPALPGQDREADRPEDHEAADHRREFDRPPGPGHGPRAPAVPRPG